MRYQIPTKTITDPVCVHTRKLLKVSKLRLPGLNTTIKAADGNKKSSYTTKKVTRLLVCTYTNVKAKNRLYIDPNSQDPDLALAVSVRFESRFVRAADIIRPSETDVIYGLCKTLINRARATTRGAALRNSSLVIFLICTYSDTIFLVRWMNSYSLSATFHNISYTYVGGPHKYVGVSFVAQLCWFYVSPH